MSQRRAKTLYRVDSHHVLFGSCPQTSRIARKQCHLQGRLGTLSSDKHLHTHPKLVLQTLPGNVSKP